MRISTQGVNRVLKGGWFWKVGTNLGGSFETEVALQGLELIIKCFVSLFSHSVLDLS